MRWRKIVDPDGYNWACDYDLVLELDELDIRGEVWGDDEEILERRTEKRLTLGGCRSSRGRSPHYPEDGIETPYRDGAHIRWDQKRLGLPMFVVCEGVAQELLPDEEETT